MENPSSATRADAFPAGLRVLVVDDDPTWVKILEKMLRKCSYEVTTCGLARTALDMLRERKDRFDIVISDVNMPDMDGFKLLEQVGLEMDLPVIMMSVDGETSRVMKGVQHGACDYLLKPVRMKELKNIWQHVFRKKILEMKEIESYDSNELNHIRNKLEEFDEWQIHSGGDISSAKKRKDVDKDHNEQDFNDTSAVKKARVVWSVDLHQKFVNAVNQIGFDKVGPKKILDLMNVPGLTRENVASHLQKYRLYLSRLQKQNEGKTLSEIVKSGIDSKDSPGKFGVQSSITTQTSNTLNSFELPARTHHQDTIPRICGEDLSNTPSFQVTDTRKVINTDSDKFHKLSYASDFGVLTSSKDGALSLDYNHSEICIPKPHQSGFNGDTAMHLRKQDQGSVTFMTAYSQLQQPGEDHYCGDHQLHASPPIHVTSTTGNDCSPSHIKPGCTFESNHARNVPSACNIDLLSSQVESKIISESHFEAASSVKGCRSTKAYSYDDKNSICSWISPPQMLNLKTEVDLSPLHDLFPCSVPNYGCFGNIGINSFEASEYEDNQTPPTADFQSSLYDELQYNCDLFDLPELPAVDYGLFT